jgi:AcrR family transcriptional regulator
MSMAPVPPTPAPAAATGKPVRLTREQNRAQTRERILASAATVFAREGYGGASVDRIAEEAGYSKGALYSNFTSKDELFLELVNYYGSIDAKELCRRLDALPDAAEIISTTCIWANGLQHEPDLRLLVLEMTRRVKGDPVLSARYRNFFEDQWRAVGSRIIRMYPEVPSTVKPVALGALVMEISYGVALQLQSEVSAGELIGIALRALRDAETHRH